MNRTALASRMLRTSRAFAIVTSMSKIQAAKLLGRALTKVESKSIREWAVNGRHRDVWVEFVQSMPNASDETATKLATIIVATAVGL